jgi:hypothetical protein
MKKSELKTDSLEKVLLEPLHESIRRACTREELESILEFESIPSCHNKGLYEDVKKQSWQLQAMEKRVSATLTITIEEKVQVFILFLNDSNIGKCIVHLLYLQYWAKKNNERHISWDDFCLKVFPWGFFSEEVLRELWDAQKVEGENMIDMVGTHESIHFKN